MLGQHRPSGSLLEVLTLEDLYNPCRPHITGQLQMGEEMQDPEIFQKSELIFPSGEPLARCWWDDTIDNKSLGNVVFRPSVLDKPSSG